MDFAAKRWPKCRGWLVMMLHEIENQRGSVPRGTAPAPAHRIDVSFAGTRRMPGEVDDVCARLQYLST